MQKIKCVIKQLLFKVFCNILATIAIHTQREARYTTTTTKTTVSRRGGGFSGTKRWGFVDVSNSTAVLSNWFSDWASDSGEFHFKHIHRPWYAHHQNTKHLRSHTNTYIVWQREILLFAEIKGSVYYSVCVLGRRISWHHDREERPTFRVSSPNRFIYEYAHFARVLFIILTLIIQTLAPCEHTHTHASALTCKNQFTLILKSYVKLTSNMVLSRVKDSGEVICT